MDEISQKLQLARIKAKELSDKVGISFPASVIRQIPDWEEHSIKDIIHIMRITLEAAEKKL